MWLEIARFSSGMGLFFIGIKFTGDGAKRIAGRRFRDLFLRYTKRTWRAAVTGCGAGFVFQSVTALSGFLTSLVGAGIIEARQALPLLLGANAGISCLSLMAVLDVKILVMVLLGLTGIIISFEKPTRLLHGATIAFGAALLLFGLETVRLSAVPLTEAPWFNAFLANDWMPLPLFFTVGIAGCMLLQSSNGVTILSATLTASGILTPEEALAVMFGSLLGSSLLSRMYTFHLTGERKRLILGQALFNVIGLSVFLPLYLVETYTGLPLLLGAAARCGLRPAGQIVAVGIAFNFLTATLLLVVYNAYYRLLARLCPDAADCLETLAYAKEISDVSPESGLLLINREQSRLMRHLATYPSGFLVDGEKERKVTPQGVHRSVDVVSTKLEGCLLDMVTKGHAGQIANALALLQANQANIRALDDTLSKIMEEMGGSGGSAAMSRLTDMFLNALDLLLLQLATVFCRDAEEDWQLLMRMVQDKGPVMERLRDRYLREQGGMTADEQWRFMHLTGLYERCIWLLRRLAEAQRRFLTAFARPESPARLHEKRPLQAFAARDLGASPAPLDAS